MSLSPSHRLVMRAITEQEVPSGEAAALLDGVRLLAGNDTLPAQYAMRQDAPVISLEDSYQYCHAMTRRHSRSFFFSTQLLPPEKQRAIRALYAFCRTSDDLVDQATDNAAAALAHWVNLVHAPQAPPNHPVLLAWNDTVHRYHVSPMLVDELLAGIAMDLTVKRYETFDDLWLYCYRVASVVGLISMQIIGYYEGAVSYAVKLGVALQLTNILRDVGEDAARGRIYLPQEDLPRFGLTDDDILAQRRDDRFRALMRYEIERAHTLYDESRPGIALLNPDGRLAIAVAGEIYRGILNKIVANDFDVYRKRAYVPTGTKLLTLWLVWRQLRHERSV